MRMMAAVLLLIAMSPALLIGGILLRCGMVAQRHEKWSGDL